MKQFILFLLLLSSITVGQAQSKHLNLEKGIAIQGYDPVAYLVSYKSIKGSSTYMTQYDGATYYFSSESNKKLFLQNPAQYLPQYGGWCAFAMGDSGEKVEINPETFKVLDDKLYLFYNAYFNNTLKSWNKDENRLRAQADKNWNNITRK